MKRLLALMIILVALVEVGHTQRSIPALSRFEAYRPLDEVRVWTVLQKDSVLGTLTSKVDRSLKMDGISGYALREELNLDFTKIGGEHPLKVSGEHYVAVDGAYLGDDFHLQITGQDARVELERDGNEVIGEISRGGQEQDVSQPLHGSAFAIDNFMFDQYELFFAMRGLRVGDVINDSVFVPRDLLLASIRGTVIDFGYQELYRGVFDSVFVIRLEQPVPMELFINRMFNLRKVNIPTQDMRVYLDVVRRDQRVGPPEFTLSRFVQLIPGYLLFALVSLIAIGLYAGSALRRNMLWLGVGTGAVSFIIVALVQFPIQEYLLGAFYQRSPDGGSPALIWAVVGILPAGVIQEGLKLLGIYLLDRIRRLTFGFGMAMGSAIGGGLGLVEACYLESLAPGADLFGWGLLHRALFIFFHATTGALLGRAFVVRGQLLWGVLGMTVLFNVVLRLFPVLIQTKQTDIGMVNIVTGLIVVLLMLWAVVWQRQPAASNRS